MSEGQSTPEAPQAPKPKGKKAKKVDGDRYEATYRGGEDREDVPHDQRKAPGDVREVRGVKFPLDKAVTFADATLFAKLKNMGCFDLKDYESGEELEAREVVYQPPPAKKRSKRSKFSRRRKGGKTQGEDLAAEIFAGDEPPEAEAKEADKDDE